MAVNKKLLDSYLDIAQKMTGSRGLIPLTLGWQPKTDHVLDDYLRRYGRSLDIDTHGDWDINEGEDDMDFTDTADSVEIKFSGNGGWMVKVGCHWRVYLNVQDLLNDLGDYLTDPKATLESYNEDDHKKKKLVFRRYEKL